MRNKFSELIKKGIASFTYYNVGPEIPEQDIICRKWNNIFSIPSDTHMHFVGDKRVITGRMVNITQDWEKFLISPFWGGINYKTSGGYMSPLDFLYKNNLRGEYTILNGEQCYILNNDLEEYSKNNPSPKLYKYVTLIDRIPKSSADLTKNSNNINDITECYKENLYDTIRALTESKQMKKYHWLTDGNYIYGYIKDSVVIL